MTNIKQTGNNIKSFSLSPTGILYIVATPIGNLGDMTFRAVEILRQVNVIACEDTRVSHKLLAHFGIQSKCIVYNDHADEKVRQKLIMQLDQGMSIALISDAGTPLVSDPGYKLVQDALLHEHKVIPIPGASSVISALSAAGLPTDAFYFGGFIPNSSGQARAKLEEVKELRATVVFFESPKRLLKTLTIMESVFGSRQCVVARELTKLHEEFVRGTCASVLKAFTDREKIRGEVVILIEPAGDKLPPDKDELNEMLRRELTSSTLKSAVDRVAKTTGLPRKEIYSMALQLRGKG